MNQPRQLDSALYALVHDEQIASFNREKPKDGTVDFRGGDFRGGDGPIAWLGGGGVGGSDHLAAAHRLPFLPIRAGLGSGVLEVNPELRTVRSPYADNEELVAMPALRLDAALVHMNQADTAGNGQYLGPDPYFDDLLAMAADRCFMSVERIVDTAELTATAPVHSLLISRMFVSGVVETPAGAHFTSCEPDYGRDEAFQAHYARAARDEHSWQEFTSRFLEQDEAAYQAAVGAFRQQNVGGGKA